MVSLSKPILRLLDKHPKKAIYFLSAFLPMLIMLIVWAIIGLYPFGSRSLMSVDFGQQYVSFFGLLKNSVLSGDFSNLSYSFTQSLGGPMAGLVGYYLLSPFNLIFIITPFQFYGFAVFLIIWLRYGAIGLAFAFLLIKRYKGLSSKKYLVPLLSTAYALSGMLVAYQMNVIFYDAMIMLPIVIAYLEELLDGGSIFKYSLTLGMMLFFQFYMGYMASIFIVLYACFYVSSKLGDKGTLKLKLSNFFKPLLRAFGASVIGGGLASVILLPVLSSLLESRGGYNPGMTFSLDLMIKPLDILSKLTIGGFDSGAWVMGPSLPNIYIGAFGFVGFILYFSCKKICSIKKWSAGVVTCIFFISFVNEFVNKIWHMGQMPLGFFYRFSWLFSFFMLVLAFQALKKGIEVSKKGKVISLILLLLACSYLSNTTFAYIKQLQPETFTLIISGHLQLIALFTIINACIILYLYWKLSKENIEKKVTRVILTAVLLLVSAILAVKGFLFSQIYLTFFTYVFVIFSIKPKMSKLAVVLLYGMTFFELGYNAYLSQVGFYYNDVDQFVDATTSVKRVVDHVKKHADRKFYRMASTFAYSRTSPSLLTYPGLENFSSTQEKSTIDHFSYMGNIGGYFSTIYANGTPLTDALYGVRYYMDFKDDTDKQKEPQPGGMNFTRYTNRYDMERYFTEKVYEDERYIVRKNPNSFSIAYGTNNLVSDLKFNSNDAVNNQNRILNAMQGVEVGSAGYVDYFTPLGFNDIEVENVEVVKENKDSGEYIYRRKDNSKEGVIRYKFTPQSDNTYYLFSPQTLTGRNGYTVSVNGDLLSNLIVFSQRQIWQITDRTPQKESVIEFRFQFDDIDLSHLVLYRADVEKIKEVLDARKNQELNIEQFNNTHIVGKVNITDESTVMMTSIPYNEGWKIKVDGKQVETKKSWDSFLSFPISRGKHKVELFFKQKWSTLGLVLSVLSLIVLFIIWKKENKPKSRPLAS
ncbi:MAG: YfhO family protein [Streptococcus sp.]|uniref:glycosyltransferase PgfM1 n=1 Tax=Streptococcus TaxID=1301 RepID=UPI00257B86F0|nr:YfhO family protein [Streptococcus sp.]MBS4898998.1 YfhO family protein [Streptococcus sp.]